jgi:hypothetical protein
VLSDSEHTTEDDSDNPDDDSISVDSDVSSESNDSDDNSYDSHFLDGDLDDASVFDFDELTSSPPRPEPLRRRRPSAMSRPLSTRPKTSTTTSSTWSL